jgi:plasmid maintenance system antidote protein VapI/Zn-dependent peptidase ImmA (M78 family)
MVDDAPFAPDWVSPPGDTIAAILEERRLSANDLANSMDWTSSNVDELLHGRAILTAKIAKQLAASLGSSPDFWARREARYRENLERLRSQASRPASQGWLDNLPAKEMMNWGWVEAANDKSARAAACPQFFGVPSVGAWRKTYEQVLHTIAFRTSATFESKPEAVAAWLRQGEIEASKIKCNSWNRERFRKELVNIRALTRQSDLGVFLPKLIQRCALCGVAVVVLRAPKECKASGATRFLSPTRPMLLLSFRYLSDDHFWFTFFHEAAHLILHSDRCIFLEGDGRLTSEEEDEANNYAADTLVPTEFQEEMLALTANKIAVMRFAKKVGVARGIIVGQLQHRGIIDRDQLNGLKKRYRWVED